MRTAPVATESEIQHGVPLFLDQLILTLRLEQEEKFKSANHISGKAGGEDPSNPEVAKMAGLHGGELLKRGFTVEQVVHDYGDLCQAITDMAFTMNEVIEVHEFSTLNRCLDNAIAAAVTAFNYERDFMLSEQQAAAYNLRMGFFAHELRNLLNTATMVVYAIKDGDLGMSGATAAVLDRTLVNMCTLIDRSLADVRLTADMPMRNQVFSVAAFIAELKLSAGLEAQLKKCVLSVSDVDPRLAVDGDRDLLLSAVGNLLQNAFKFTKHGTEVALRAYASGDRFIIDVEDHGDGLAPGQAERLFDPFIQEGEDQSGLGLGLSIARRSVEANQGTLRVRNKVPNDGCIFTIDLPRCSLSA